MVEIAKDRRTFSGWGTISVVDRQNDYIDVLKEFRDRGIMEIMMSRGAPVMDSHSNHQVGRIISYEYKMAPSGRPGLYLTAEIFKNYPSDDEMWEAIKAGKYQGFSLGGKAGEKTAVCNEDGCHNNLTGIESWEWSCVETPANQEALIDSVNKLAKSHHVYKAYPITKYVSQCGDKWCVYSESGKHLGTHGSEEDAYKQLYAIDKGFFANVKRSLGQYFDEMGDFEIDEWIREHWRPNHHVERDWSQPIKDAWHKKDEEYERLRHLKKAKVYVKNPSEAPKGVKLEQGPKGGHYYESDDISGHTSGELANERIVNSPMKPFSDPNPAIQWYKEKIHSGLGNILFDRSNHERHLVLDNTNDIDIINFFTGDPDMGIRWKAAYRADMEHLYKLVNDEYTLIREKVAERIDQNGLHIMLGQDERDSNVKVIIAQRIDLSGLEYIINKWNNDGLYANALSFANKRLPYVRFLTPMIDNFNKTGKIELPEQFRNYVNDAMKNNESGTIEEATDEFYNLLDNGKYNEFHHDSKIAWEGSSSSNLALLLKDSVKRQFGGEIRYHDAIKDIQTKIEELHRKYPQELVDNYVKVQKQLTRAYLDVMFPDTNEVTIYRGTTTEETKSIGANMNASIQSNSISSWTLKQDVAKSFANAEHHERNIRGLVLKLKIHKDEIWSTFMSHNAYMGNEQEILTIGNKDRIVDIVDFYSSPENTQSGSLGEYGKL